jgi:hypothetical protein
MRIRKRRYLCKVEDGRVFKTKQPYIMFMGNKVVKVTKVFMFLKRVIYLEEE